MFKQCSELKNGRPEADKCVAYFGCFGAIRGTSLGGLSWAITRSMNSDGMARILSLSLSIHHSVISCRSSW